MESDVFHSLEKAGVLNEEDIHLFLDASVESGKLSIVDSDAIFEEFKKILTLTQYVLLNKRETEEVVAKINAKLHSFYKKTNSEFFRDLYLKARSYFQKMQDEEMILIADAPEDLDPPKSTTSQLRDHLIKLVNGAWFQKEHIFKLFHSVKQYCITIPVKQKHFYNFSRILLNEINVKDFNFFFFKDHLFIYKVEELPDIIDKLKKMQKSEITPTVIRRIK